MRQINKVVGELSGWLILAMAAMLIVGFISRLMYSPVIWTIEFAQFAMVTVIFLGLAICEQNKSHVKVELIISRLPTRMWQAVNIFTYLVALSVISMMLWGSIEEARFSFISREAFSGFVPLPLFPVKFTIVLGIALYIIQLLINTIKEAKKPSPKPSEAEVITTEEVE